MLSCDRIRAVNSTLLTHPPSVLDRHSMRRTGGVPTVSLLVGPALTAGRTWRRWAQSSGRRVIDADLPRFPIASWMEAVAEQVNVPGVALERSARCAGRGPEQFLGVWRNMTGYDRAQFWNAISPEPDDDLLRSLANCAGDVLPAALVAACWCDVEDRAAPMLVRLAPATLWPGVIFHAASTHDLAAAGEAAVKWATRMAAAPVAIAVAEAVWREYAIEAPDSRTKAILQEGEVILPQLDAANVQRTLLEGGLTDSATAAIVAVEADEELIESAVIAARATAQLPSLPSDDDNARSDAERFLFLFLESIPETAGRFELNAKLDFRFGPRAAEVDLLCRAAHRPRVDGYSISFARELPPRPDEGLGAAAARLSRVEVPPKTSFRSSNPFATAFWTPSPFHVRSNPLTAAISAPPPSTSAGPGSLPAARAGPMLANPRRRKGRARTSASCSTRELSPRLRAHVRRAGTGRLFDERQADTFSRNGSRPRTARTVPGAAGAVHRQRLVDDSRGAKYLFPKAAGLSARRRQSWHRTRAGNKLSAYPQAKVRRRRPVHGEAGAGGLACKELGFPEETTLDGVVGVRS